MISAEPGIAAERLLRAGCRRIGVVGSGARHPTQIRRRRVAFADCVEEAGIEPVVWASGETTYETGMEAARGCSPLMTLDGVFCVTDLMALGFLDGARAMGRRIPEDLSVIGFDDILAIGLGCLSPDHRQAVDERSHRIRAGGDRTGDARGEGTALVHEVPPVELVERATVRTVA